MERKLLGILLVTTTAFAEVTQDILDHTQWATDGVVLDHTPSHVHFDYRGGSISQTVDISAYEGQQQIRYFTDAYACENQIGGHCGSGNYDTFTITLTTDTGETVTQTYQIGNQWQEYDAVLNPASDAALITVEVYGIDDGFWGGWYGPVAYTGEMNVTYDPAAAQAAAEEAARLAAEEAERQAALAAQAAAEEAARQALAEEAARQAAAEAAQEQLVQDTVVMDQVYTAPVVDLPAVELPAVDVAVEVEMPAVEASVETPEPSTPEPTQESPSREPSPQETPSMSTAIATVMSNIDVSTASMESIGDAAGDPASPVAQVLALAIMAAQGAEIEDVRIEQPELPKGPEIRDNRKMADRFWVNALSSDAKFDKYMVDAQWQK